MVLSTPRYTIEDLESFPEDGQRYELLDGFLIVTPLAGLPHQIVAGRLHTRLDTYLGGSAHVVGPGVVEHAANTHLEPDLLVFPQPIPASHEWTDLSGHWLAVEILSRSSRRYDQDFKRNAYLALGVREVWLVDWRNHEILRSIAGGRTDAPHRDRLRWRPETMKEALVLDLNEIFEGLAR